MNCRTHSLAWKSKAKLVEMYHLYPRCSIGSVRCLVSETGVWLFSDHCESYPFFKLGFWRLQLRTLGLQGPCGLVRVGKVPASSRPYQSDVTWGQEKTQPALILLVLSPSLDTSKLLFQSLDTTYLKKYRPDPRRASAMLSLLYVQEGWAVLLCAILILGKACSRDM